MREHTDNKRNLIFKLIYLANMAAIILFVIYLYWSFYPYKPLVFNTPTFTVGTKTVKTGGTVWYNADYCRNTNLVSTVSRSFVNGIVFTTPTVHGSRKNGCHKIAVGITVPAELPPGKYNLENVYSYQVNPIRVITVKQKSDSFMVTETTQAAKLRLKDY